jgi:ADP-ribosyl-[dinitrogen reductase] hydrolase
LTATRSRPFLEEPFVATNDQSRRDRIEGALLGLAAGDALGAGYEFGPPFDDDIPVFMQGGGPFNVEPGQWTDDTAMAMGIAIAMRDARQRGTGSDEALFDGIAASWSEWAQDAFDIGNQTRDVFHHAGVFTGRRTTTAARLRAEARAFHDRSGQSAGNGSLMRTAPVAIFALDLPEAEVADLAIAISALTHVEASAGEACALWCLAIRHAIETGELDIRVGLPMLEEARRDHWLGVIEEAESFQPRGFQRNGWVVQALQGAWSAIVHTQANEANHLVRALEAAVRGGRDTDTVAAIAGGLLGAAYGGSAVPDDWFSMLHGWPGYDAEDLQSIAVAIAPA